MITHVFDDQRGLTLFLCSGETTIRSIQLAARTAYQTTSLHDTRLSLWDMEEANLSMSADEVFMTKESTETINGLRPTGKTAFVLASHLEEAYLKIINGNHHWATEWAYFSSRDEAYSWLFE